MSLWSLMLMFSGCIDQYCQYLVADADLLL